MKIILASNNKGKIKEFEKLLNGSEVIAFKELLGDYEVVEEGKTFQENAVKKAKEIYDKLNDKNIIVISDDSGISVPILNNEPGIYSARYAKENATDRENNQKLIMRLKQLGIKKTEAFYTACIAIVFQDKVYTVHGWMHGFVIDEEKGLNGFGYDPMFIANKQTQTLGELSYEVKKEFSHRSKALFLAKKILDVILE